MSRGIGRLAELGEGGVGQPQPQLGDRAQLAAAARRARRAASIASACRAERRGLAAQVAGVGVGEAVGLLARPREDALLLEPQLGAVRAERRQQAADRLAALGVDDPVARRLVHAEREALAPRRGRAARSAAASLETRHSRCAGLRGFESEPQAMNAPRR